MKTEAIKRLINAVDVWVACGVFDGTNFNPNTDDAKNELEQLALHNVSQQRKLFKSFLEKVVKETEVGDLTWQTRDEAKELLKIFNCG